MKGIDYREIVDICFELEDAYNGNHAFGGGELELYSFRLIDDASDEENNQQILKNLQFILSEFMKVRNCKVVVNDWDWRDFFKLEYLIKIPHRWRIKVIK